MFGCNFVQLSSNTVENCHDHSSRLNNWVKSGIFPTKDEQQNVSEILWNHLLGPRENHFWSSWWLQFPPWREQVISKLRNSSWVRLVGMLVLQVQRSFPFHRVLRMLTALPSLSLRMGVGSTEFYNAQPTNQGRMSTGTSKNMYILLYELRAKLLVWEECHHQIGFAGFEYGLLGYRFWGGPLWISALSRFEVLSATSYYSVPPLILATNIPIQFCHKKKHSLRWNHHHPPTHFKNGQVDTHPPSEARCRGSQPWYLGYLGPYIPDKRSIIRWRCRTPFVDCWCFRNGDVANDGR